MKMLTDVVFESFSEGDLPYSDEDVIKFALGYHLFKKREARVGFNIKHAGSMVEYESSLRFSPDVDVWEEHDGQPMTLIGYEVKSWGKGLQKAPRSELNKAIGQTLMLMEQPYNGNSVLNRAYIAIPPMKLDSDWEKTFIRTIGDLPIGLVLITTDGIEEIVDAEDAEIEDREFPTPKPAAGLRNKQKAKQNPDSGISSLAKELKSKYNIDYP